MPRRRRVRPNYPLLWAIAFTVGAIAAYIGIGVLSASMAPKRMGVPRGLLLPLVARALDATFAVWFFAVGSSIGSFLNVVAYRLPLGRTLGGHSACPYCCTTIAASDNIPVFAWLRLRGRCRTCRLPISIQYPLVELAVGLVFLAVYFLEFGVAGSNLPGTTARPIGIGLIWMSVTRVLAVRVLLYLFTLCGLIGAALIVLRHSRPPASLFVCAVLVTCLGQLALPAAVVMPWWSMIGTNWTQQFSAQPMSVLDALLTMIAGGLVGVIVATLTLPLVAPAGNRLAWSGVLICLGVLLGWQALPLVTCFTLIATLAGNGLLRQLLGRLGQQQALINPVTWSWLGVFLMRAGWKWFDAILRSFEPTSPWLGVLVTLGATAVLSGLVGHIAHSQSISIAATPMPATVEPS